MKNNIEKDLEKAFKNALINSKIKKRINLSSKFNVIKNFDSLTIVNLILETELIMEKKLGKYVPITNMDIFDQKRSPLLQWSKWIDYVKNFYNK